MAAINNTIVVEISNSIRNTLRNAGLMGIKSAFSICGSSSMLMGGFKNSMRENNELTQQVCANSLLEFENGLSSVLPENFFQNFRGSCNRICTDICFFFFNLIE